MVCVCGWIPMEHWLCVATVWLWPGWIRLEACNRWWMSRGGGAPAIWRCLAAIRSLLTCHGLWVAAMVRLAVRRRHRLSCAAGGTSVGAGGSGLDCLSRHAADPPGCPIRSGGERLVALVRWSTSAREPTRMDALMALVSGWPAAERPRRWVPCPRIWSLRRQGKWDRQRWQNWLTSQQSLQQLGKR